MIVIGIAGASGAGKSSLAHRLCQQLNARSQASRPPVAAVLHEDSYYRARDDLSLEQRNQVNYDHPDAIEHALLARHLAALRDGQTVAVPQYDYAVHNRKKETVALGPVSVLLLEGILVLHDPRIRQLLDLAVYVEAPLGECLARRLERDLRQRNRSRESILRQFRHTVRPMFFQFVKPTRWVADMIIPTIHSSDRALCVLQSWLAPRC